MKKQTNWSGFPECVKAALRERHTHPEYFAKLDQITRLFQYPESEQRQRQHDILFAELVKISERNTDEYYERNGESTTH